MDSNKWIIDDNGYEKNLVYFPGWATDISFLQRDKLPFNLIYPEPQITPSDIPSLNEILTMPTFMLGWSLGGFLAMQFARLYPGKVSKLIIASIRGKYPQDMISQMRGQLIADKNGTLKNFYRQAFLPTMTANYRDFRKNEVTLIEKMQLSQLLTGLEYLENNALGETTTVQTICLHGEKDIIAPVNDVNAWVNRGEVEYIVIPDAPHALPYCDLFYEIINEKFK